MPSQSLADGFPAASSTPPCTRSAARPPALAGIPAAAAALSATLGVADRPWGAVVGALVRLLRAHAAGMTRAIAGDELVAALAGGGGEARGDRRGVVWCGEVVRVQAGLRPAGVAVRRGDGGVFGIFVEGGGVAVAGVGVRVRAWPGGGVVRDVGGRAAVEAVEEVRREDGRRVGGGGCLLPGVAVAFEMRVGVSAGGGEYPVGAESFLAERTLQAVWTERCSSPEWVSGRVVEVSPSAVRLQDIDGFGSDQPTVLLVLEGREVGFARLLTVGEVVLLRKPAVVPTGVSFDLWFGEETVVFVGKGGAVAGLQVAEKKALNVLAPPPLKRQRVSGRGEGPEEYYDEVLAESRLPVTPEHVLALRCPVRQPPFDMLAVAFAPPRIPGMTQSEAGVECMLHLVGGITLTLPASWGDEVSQIGAGHVLWLRRLAAGEDSPRTWTCASFENVSRLPGVICSPFVRDTVSVELLNSDAAPRPDTVHVDVVVDVASVDNDKLTVVLGVSDYDQSPSASGGKESRRLPCPATITVSNAVVLSQLLGTSISEFWFGRVNAKTRSKRLVALVGCRYRMSVALATDDANDSINDCAALSRVSGTG